MGRYWLGKSHGGRRFFILLIAFTSLAEDTASKLRVSWPVDPLGHVDAVSVHVQQYQLQLYMGVYCLHNL